MQKLKDRNIIYLSETVLRLLEHNRIISILDFLEEDVNKISTLIKLSLPQVYAMRNDILQKYSASLVNGSSLVIDRLINKTVLKSGIESLDSVLLGFPVGYITEICGLADSGKTQFCMQVAISCVMDLHSTVLYIDTKGDFSAVRVQKILDARGLSHKEMAVIMYKIRVINIWTIEETIELLKCLKNKTLEIENLTLIIIDSLPCLMLQFLGESHKIGLSLLNNFVNYSRYLMKELNICIICTNIQTRWVDQDIEDESDQATFWKDSYNERKTRCLGRYWQHIPALILQMEKIQEDSSNSCPISISLLKAHSNMQKFFKCMVNLNKFGIT